MRNATPLAAAQLGVNVLLLVNTVVLARILGVESYGLLAIGIAMYGLTAFLSDAGLGMWGMRAIDDDPYRWATVSRLTAARLVTVSFALAVAFSAVLLLPLPEGAKVPSLVMVVTMVPAGFSVEWALIGVERTGRAATARLAVGVAMLAFSPPLALAAGPTGAAVGYVAAVTVGCGVSWILLVATIGRPRGVAPRGVVATLRHSLPMGVSATLEQVYWLSDSLLVGILLGPVAAGLYSAPMRLLAATLSLAWVVGTSLLPVYRALDTIGPGGVPRLATLTTRLLILLCVPAVGAAVGGATTIVTSVLGADFAASAPILAIGSMIMATRVCIVPTGYAILARRHDNRYLAAAVTTVVTSIPLIVLLAPTWGIGGVAIAMLAAQVVGAIVLMVGAARTGVRLAAVPIAAATAVALVSAVLAGVASASNPWGIASLILVLVFAEAPFVGFVAWEIGRARRAARGGEASLVGQSRSDADGSSSHLR